MYARLRKYDWSHARRFARPHPICITSAHLIVHQAAPSQLHQAAPSHVLKGPPIPEGKGDGIAALPFSTAKGARHLGKDLAEESERADATKPAQAGWRAAQPSPSGALLT